MKIKSLIKRLYIKFFQSVVSILLTPLGKRNHRFLLDWLQGMIPTLSAPIQGSKKHIRFYCPSSMTVFRAETLLIKEPETIEWIDSFDEEDVLWDIGASVGVYSLYAAIQGHRVLAFEPSSGNYWILNKNIHLNRLDELIKAYPIALSDETKLGEFNMADQDLGGSLYKFGEHEEERRVVFRQGMLGYSIDDFIHDYHVLIPNHIKIDVDGIEKNIVKGGGIRSRILN